MVVIIKYNAGNIKSVENAVKRLGFDCLVTDDADEIRGADKVIFPGVGEASSAMAHLKSKGLDKLIVSLKQPVLGVCLGQQLMCSYSEEGETDCLGIFDCQVKAFPPEDKVPHMGWNEITGLQTELFQDVQENSDVYFVHSYYCEPTSDQIASCDYITPFAAAMHKDNFYACQFHPEKSAGIGEQILKNFLEL